MTVRAGSTTGGAVLGDSADGPPAPEDTADGPPALEEEHDRRVADLEPCLRQGHAVGDLAALGDRPRKSEAAPW